MKLTELAFSSILSLSLLSYSTTAPNLDNRYIFEKVGQADPRPDSGIRKRAAEADPDPTPQDQSAPGGLWATVEGFIRVIPHVPGAAVETGYNTGKFLVELLPLPNATDVVQTTWTGVRKWPLHTAVTGLSNIVFCNPVIAGVNYGRCYAWFQTRENEEEIRINKLNREKGKEEERTKWFGIFDDIEDADIENKTRRGFQIIKINN